MCAFTFILPLTTYRNFQNAYLNLQEVVAHGSLFYRYIKCKNAAFFYKYIYTDLTKGALRKISKCMKFHLFYSFFFGGGGGGGELMIISLTSQEILA